MIGFSMKITHDKSSFKLVGRYWSGTYPLADLPKWLNFYQRLREDLPKSGNSYDECIEELKYLSETINNNKNPSL